MKPPLFDVEEYVRHVESFHSHVAPGVITGGFMVNLAKCNLPEGTLFNAICETPVCLPDAIQLLTPCTIGNGRLKILNFGRFALTLYDKEKGSGCRVSLDSKRVDRWPEIKTWFFKLKAKTDQNTEILLAQIKEAGEELCKIEHVLVQPNFLQKKRRGEMAICPRCEEAFPARDGEFCRPCQGYSPYVSSESQGREWKDNVALDFV